jgi:hypothetical protein
MVIGLKIWSSAVQSGFRTRDLSINGPTRLPTALTGHTQNKAGFAVWIYIVTGGGVENLIYYTLTMHVTDNAALAVFILTLLLNIGHI